MKLLRWLWTDGALWLGRAYLVLVVMFAVVLTAAWLNSHIRPPPQLTLPPDHPLIDRQQWR